MKHKVKRKRWMLIGAGALLVLAGVLHFVLRLQPALTITPDIPSTCPGTLAYAVTLRASGDGVGDARIAVFANDVFIEQLRTDQNGRFSSSFSVPASWCGTAIVLRATYAGGFFDAPASGNTTAAVKIPTTLLLTVPDGVQQDDPTRISVQLLANTTPVANKTVVVTAPNETIADLTTDEQGSASSTYAFSFVRPTSVTATFAGDDAYQAAQITQTITVHPRSCNDGTVVNTCSTSIGYYCTPTKQLVFNCANCGCTPGLVCYENTCISPDEKATQIVSGLQDEIVYVKNSFATGSGVILAHQGGDTVILTNRHVVADATGISDVTIRTNDQQTLTATDVRVAPDAMDFALITVHGEVGTSVTLSSAAPAKGATVVALGSPLGLQGAVARGIVSNLLSTTTTEGYRYNVIQTDAAINPGNSGGGLFLEENGRLVGINTFKLANTEGLNFAIDIRELANLPSFATWPVFVPTPHCADGTVYGACSTSNVGFQCSAGQLAPSCKTCGCPSTYPYCPSSGVCFKCPTGDNAYETASGQGFCCPPGSQGTTDGRCS